MKKFIQDQFTMSLERWLMYVYILNYGILPVDAVNAYISGDYQGVIGYGVALMWFFFWHMSIRQNRRIMESWERAVDLLVRVNSINNRN